MEASRWLNPPERVAWVDQPVPGCPARPGTRDDAAAKASRARTHSNFYNSRPQWPTDACAEIDASVAAAYGWNGNISEDEALGKLLALNSMA